MMVFQPQKPQRSVLGLGDILLSMLASLSPFSLTGIIKLCYKRKKKKVSAIFFTPSHLSRSQKLAPVPATESQLLWWEEEGRPAASPRPPATALRSRCGSRSVVNTNRQDTALEGKRWAVC